MKILLAIILSVLVVLLIATVIKVEIVLSKMKKELDEFESERSDYDER